MRILDEDSDLALRHIVVLLTNKEAIELRDDLTRIIAQNNSLEHVHIDDMEYEHEVTLSLYKEGHLSCFHERIKKLIREDK
jgi:hypothetical protein